MQISPLSCAVTTISNSSEMSKDSVDDEVGVDTGCCCFCAKQDINLTCIEFTSTLLSKLLPLDKSTILK